MSDERPSVRTLKRSPARTVRVETSPPGATPAASARVVKRFESRGLLAGRRDAARARREHELLVRLFERGLRVPRPLGLERRDDAWEVAMELVPDAVPLQDVLLERAPWPARPERLARELGELLARLHAAGVEHPDLHPGNVLIDGAGCPWAIDFHKARLVERLAPARLEAHLVRLAAGTRERCSLFFRLRALLAWRRGLPSELAPPRADLPGLCRRVDERARHERLATVRERRLRWTREGTAVRAVALEGGDGFERADRPGGLARAVQATLERGGPAQRRAVLPYPHDPSRRVLVLRAGAWRTLCSGWYASARLEEHAVPAARPLAIARGPAPWAAYELPCWGHAAAGWDDVCEARGRAALAALLAALHDRGLTLPRPAPELFWTDGSGRLQLAHVPRLAPAPAGPPSHALRPWLAALGRPDRALELARGFASSLGLAAGERERLLAELRLA